MRRIKAMDWVFVGGLVAGFSSLGLIVFVIFTILH